MAQTTIERSISSSLLRLRMNAPFFAALSLFATFRADPSIPTAATDGRTVFYNPAYLEALPQRQLDGLLLHEVMHAALLHPARRGTRETVRWNIAADIVVNGIVSKQAYLELPPGGIREPALELLRVEEIYELLTANHTQHCDCLREQSRDGGPDAARRLVELETYWERAMRQAEAVARMGQGTLPAGMERILGGLGAAQVDWRSALWRFLVRTPTDFSGFDRRFFHRGLYLEMLEGDGLRAYLAVDTSGSVGETELRLFMGEVGGILGAYPHISAELYYADAELHGPFDLAEQLVAPTPMGGGGTAFEPFFGHLAEHHQGGDAAVAIYLTDGYGSFPVTPPGIPTLWVVTPGGLADEDFPFGDVVRLLPGG
jgi:predicted metal-dependent peptidase